MTKSQNVLLLQGPVGPFFSRFQASLLSKDIDCFRVLFNAGDRLYSHKNKFSIEFNGNLDEWGIWFESYLKENSPSVVILFGAYRPIHAISRDICKRLGTKVLCLEEGYFRPGYVTIEEFGNNACSPIAGRLPNSDLQPICENLDQKLLAQISSDSFRNRCWYGFLYYSYSEIFSSNQQRQLFHKNLNLFGQAIGWLRNLFLWMFSRKRDERIFKKLSPQNYYLVALQLDADMQSQFQSNGWKKPDLINEVIQSFANAGNSSSHLVFKVHPLERGHFNHAKMIKETARNFGIQDRVWILQTMNIGQWVKSSKGFITVNSTSGFSAIYHGVPILLFGNAIYEHEQLVYKLRNKSDLDEFWNSLIKSNKSQRIGYLNWVKQNACSMGDFYTKLGSDKITQNIIEKIS